MAPEKLPGPPKGSRKKSSKKKKYRFLGVNSENSTSRGFQELVTRYNFLHLGVSKNRGGPPKSSILIGFSIINHQFWGFSPSFWVRHRSLPTFMRLGNPGNHSFLAAIGHPSKVVYGGHSRNFRRRGFGWIGWVLARGCPGGRFHGKISWEPKGTPPKATPPQEIKPY